MSFLDEVRLDRQPLAKVLKKHRGIRKIVEDLYPDRAHFIYELLQNAEDAGAGEARFVLTGRSVSFEHDGRPFSKEDIWGITDIGEGTKTGDEDQIGRFGVGFKAVFAYSENPHIWSPTFAFKIYDLVLTEAIMPEPTLGHRTRFEFPFTNSKKSPATAYSEVKAGLEELAETTLLFLSNLKSIQWRIGQQGDNEVLRIEHSENHVEVLKRYKGNTTASRHFLRFSDSLEGSERLKVAVAFALDHLPNVTAFDVKLPLAKQFSIVGANPGRVSVFFPAEKESSGLRFHLQAPFVPELSRASIKETASNDPLFKQLARLSATSLHCIRELNLLSVGFLGVLPNPQDDIPPRYQSILSAIVEEMKNNPLTPTHSKSHAPAKYLLQGKASLKELLSANDLDLLVDYNDVPYQWAMSAAQKNSKADQFLTGLGIAEWDTSHFFEMLCNKTGSNTYNSGPPYNVTSPQVMAWLTAKPLAWHQQMYALLRAEISATPEYKRKHAVEQLKKLRLVRLSDDNYSLGTECYFAGEGIKHDELLPRVAAGAYSSGKSKTQQAEAKKLLEEIGVREVGEKEQVEAILKQRYTAESFQPKMKDLTRFIALVESDPQQAKLFADYFIFKRADGKWGQPGQTYVDGPLLDTGLSAYYSALGEGARRAALHDSYQQSRISAKKLLKFAELVGVQVRLKIELVSCRRNPAASDFVHSAEGGWSKHGINQDYTIPSLEEILQAKNKGLSRLIWKTACDTEKDTRWLKARYRNNSSYPTRESRSQLVCILRESAWIPQTNGRFVRPSEASQDLLPKGFPFDKGYEWLAAIGFGEQNQQRIEENKKQETSAKALGFSTAQILERAKQFAALPEEAQEKLLAEFQQRSLQELPQSNPSNPERRAARVAQQASQAPQRITEERKRSVSVGREDVKLKAAEYLNEQYTTPNGEIICQVCKTTLPFKLDDGTYYYESVEFLGELKRRHYQNYLALCPNHSAMFQYAHGSRDRMMEMFIDLKTNELDVVLAQVDATIYFTKTHIADLKTVITAEKLQGKEL
jgi:hypothetical protein